MNRVRMASSWPGIGLGVLLAGALLFLGCALRDGNPAGVGDTGLRPVDAAPVPAADVAFSFQTRLAASATAHPALRVAPTASASCVLRLVSLDRAAATASPPTFTRVVPIGADGSVAASFSAIPARTTVAQIELRNADLDGFTTFRGALDLAAGPNRIIVHPTGSGLRQDLVGRLLEHAAVTPSLLTRLPENAAAMALDLVGSLDRQATTVQLDALEAFVRQLQPPAWPLSVEAIRDAQTRVLGIGSAAANPDALWTPGHTFVTRTLNQEEAGRMCGWRDPTELGAAASLRADGVHASPRAAVTLPRQLDWRNQEGRNWLPPIRNQYPYATCVAFSCCAAVEAMMRIQANLAPVDLAEWALLVEGGAGAPAALSQGWSLRAALAVLTGSGVPAEEAAPYHLAPAFGVAVPAVARRYRVAGHQVAQGVEGIKNALQGGPVVVGMRVYEDFMRYSGGVYWHATGREVGWHTLLLVGYDDDRDCWIARNSWGTGWGELGYCRIRRDQVQNSGYLFDFAHAGLAPEPPASVQASVGEQGVDVSWSPVSGASRYNVYWSTTPGVGRATGVRVAGVGSPWRHTGLNTGWTCHYVVTAENDTGESIESGEVMVRIPEPDAMPRRLQAAPRDGAVTLTWESPILPATAYILHVATASASLAGAARIVGVTPPFVHDGLPNGVTVYYAVSAIVNGRESAPTQPIAVVPGLPAPTGVTATGSHRAVRLTWNPVPGATAYQITYATTPGVDRATGIRLGNVASPFVHTGLTNGATYHYVVSAGIGAAEGAWSAEVAARPSVAPPAGVVASAGPEGVTVTWSALPGVTGYRLYWTDTPGASPRDAGQCIDQATSPFLHRQVRSGLTYDYVVTAFDASGESPPSAVARATSTSVGLTAIRVVDARTLEVTFSQPMDAGLAMAPSTYQLTGSGRGTLAPTPATVGFVSGNIYRLGWQTGEMAAGGDLTVSVAATLRDALGNPLGSVQASTLLGGGTGVGPVVAEVVVIDGTHVDVTFSEPMNAVDLGQPANYAISGSGRGSLATAPTTVAVLAPARVRLAWATGEMRHGGDVSVGVAAGVRDAVGNPMAVPRAGTQVRGGIGAAPTALVDTKVGQPDPTGDATVLFTVVFNEPVIGLTAAGVVLGGSASPTTAVVRALPPLDGTTWEIAVSGMTGDGTVTAGVAAGAATDLAGNPSLTAAVRDNLVVRDSARPNVGLVRVIDGRQIEVTFSKTVNASDAVVPANYTVSGAGRGTLATSPASVTRRDGAIWRLAWPAGEMRNGGDVTVTVAATVRDVLGNPMGSIRAGTHAGGGTGGVAPTVTVNQAPGQGDPAGLVPVRFRVTFSEPVTGFTGADLSWAGAASPTAVSVTEVAPRDGTTWEVAATGVTGDGPIRIGLAADRVTDLAGHGNLAAVSTDDTVTLDRTPPAVLAVTVADGRAVDVIYSEPVIASDALVAANYTLTGSGTGTLAPHPATVTLVGGFRYRLSWLAGEMRNLGDLCITVASPVCDLAGNPLGTRAATHVQGGTGGIAPTVALEQAPGQADPTPAGVVYFSVIFSEPVINFDASDLVLSGTAGPATASVSLSPPLDGARYTVAVSGMTDDGLVRVRLLAGRCTDLAGHDNLAAVSNDNTVTRDTVGPALTAVNVSDGSHLEVTFSEPMLASDVLNPAIYTLSGSGRGTLATSPAAVTALSPVGVRLGWPAGEMRHGGDCTVTVATGVRDLAGNPIGPARVASHLGGGRGSPPVPTVQQAAGQLDPASATPVAFRVTFNERVVGFGPSAVGFSGTASPAAWSVTELTPHDGTTFAVEVSAFDWGGELVLGVPAGRVTDLAGNGNLAAVAIDDAVVYDVTPPSLTSVWVDDGASGGVIGQVWVYFSEVMATAGVAIPANFTLSGSGMGSLAIHPTTVEPRGDRCLLSWADGEMVTGGDISITVPGTLQCHAGFPLNGVEDPSLTVTHSGGGRGFPPAVTDIAVVDANRAVVFFDEAVGDGATSVTHYGIAGPAYGQFSGLGTVPSGPPDSAVKTGSATVLLTWSSGALQAGGYVTVSVAGVPDLVGNSMITADARQVETPGLFLEFVLVGDPGNASDTAVMETGGDPEAEPTTGYGSVAQSFAIGKFEVTNAQYCAFLNKVAPGDDVGMFYDPRMSAAVPANRGGINRSGTYGNYTYSVANNFGDKPVVWVSYHHAVRFVNWLHNGAGDYHITEDGAYTITGGSYGGGEIGPRNPGARFFLPNEDEWYKAAYYKGGSAAAGYWLYPTQTDADPVLAGANASGYINNPGSNVINCYNGADWNGQDGHVTSVGGAGMLSRSAYGTYDQGGNAYEWVESSLGPYGMSRCVRGGCWFFEALFARSTLRVVVDFGSPWYQSNWWGFRVAHR